MAITKEVKADKIEVVNAGYGMIQFSPEGMIDI